MKKFEFSFFQIIAFYCRYAFYKAILFKNVKKGLFTLYVAETIWLINHIFGTELLLPDKIKRNYFETRYGKFYIHPDLLSTVAISPAFERDDINYLIKIIERSIKNNKKILFLDIGAYVGLYSVLIGNRFKKYKNLNIIAFEPSTNYLSEPTLEILRKNIKINKIKNIKLMNIGIGSKSGMNQGGIKTNTLSEILGGKYSQNYDEIYIKLDIDDFVMDGLEGIMDFVNSSRKTYLFIEDFIERKKVVKFLKKNKFTFENKLTEYNSFWYK